MHLSEQQHFQGEGIASAHDRVSFKHPIEPADIEPDARPRSLFVDRVSAGTGSGEGPRYQLSAHQPAGAAARFEAPMKEGNVGKDISVNDNRLTVRYRFNGVLPCRFETQINLAMPSCDGFLGRYVFEGEIPGGFGAPLKIDAMTTLMLEDGVLGGTLELLSSQPVLLEARPHHTVSQSEDGFEKIMQAVTLILSWLVDAGDSEMTLALEVRRA